MSLSPPSFPGLPQGSSSGPHGASLPGLDFELPLAASRLGYTAQGLREERDHLWKVPSHTGLSYLSDPFHTHSNLSKMQSFS